MRLGMPHQPCARLANCLRSLTCGQAHAHLTHPPNPPLAISMQGFGLLRTIGGILRAFFGLIAHSLGHAGELVGVDGLLQLLFEVCTCCSALSLQAKSFTSETIHCCRAPLMVDADHMECSHACTVWVATSKGQWHNTL